MGRKRMWMGVGVTLAATLVLVLAATRDARGAIAAAKVLSGQKVGGLAKTEGALTGVNIAYIGTASAGVYLVNLTGQGLKCQVKVATLAEAATLRDQIAAAKTTKVSCVGSLMYPGPVDNPSKEPHITVEMTPPVHQHSLSISSLP